MKAVPNSVGQALTFAQHQHSNPSRDWTGYCQMFCHDVYGVGGGYASAIAQWHGAPASHKHVGGDPDTAPVGSLLCFVRTNGTGFGHIMLAARDFPNGTAGAWSNDLVRTGKIDKVARTAPITEWGHKYLGYIWTVNGYEIELPQPKPKPKPVVHLKSILASVHQDPKGPQGHQTAPAQVKRVEQALVAEKMLAPRYANDGSFGTTTVAAYTKWQQHLGYHGKDANGIPGLASLRALGNRHGFDVTN